MGRQPRGIPETARLALSGRRVFRSNRSIWRYSRRGIFQRARLFPAPAPARSTIPRYIRFYPLTKQHSSALVKERRISRRRAVSFYEGHFRRFYQGRYAVSHRKGHVFDACGSDDARYLVLPDLYHDLRDHVPLFYLHDFPGQLVSSGNLHSASYVYHGCLAAFFRERVFPGFGFYFDRLSYKGEKFFGRGVGSEGLFQGNVLVRPKGGAEFPVGGEAKPVESHEKAVRHGGDESDLTLARP